MEAKALRALVLVIKSSLWSHHFIGDGAERNVGREVQGPGRICFTEELLDSWKPLWPKPPAYTV